MKGDSFFSLDLQGISSIPQSTGEVIEDFRIYCSPEWVRRNVCCIEAPDLLGQLNRARYATVINSDGHSSIPHSGGSLSLLSFTISIEMNNYVNRN